MMNDRDRDVVELMQRLGGSFVSALAVCMMKADGVNFQKLKATFPEYWRDYETRVDNHAERAAKFPETKA